MHYVNLGRTGLKVSRLCLGAMTYGEPAWRAWVLPEEQRPAVHPARARARHQLLRHRRHVLARRREEVLGRALRDFAQRDDVVIATKVVLPDGRRSERSRPLAQAPAWRRSTRSLRAARHRLRRPLSDPSLGSTRRRSKRRSSALHDIVRAGKARYIGASSMFAWQFAKALYLADRHGWTRFVSMQNHYNLVYREEEREMLPLCRDRGHRGHPVEPAGARLSLPATGARADAATPRARRPTTSPTALLRGLGLSHRRSRRASRGARAACRRRRLRSRGCCTARHHRADRRRVEDGAARAGDRRARHQTDRRGMRQLEEPVRTASRALVNG